MSDTNAFSLFELLVAMSVVATLAVIGYPQYQAYIERSYQNQAKVNLIAIAHSLAKYHREKQTYLGYLPNISDSRYRYILKKATSEDYVIVATTQDYQTKEKKCLTISLDNKGQQEISSECY